MKALAISFLLMLALSYSEGNFFNLFGRNKETKETYNFEKLPDHKNFAAMARYIVHNSNWTAVSFKSYEKETFNLSLATLFSTADGPMSNGTGVPYFYLTEMEMAVKNIVRNDSRCGLMMSLAQSDICKKNKWDEEDPRCARVFLTGKLKPLANSTSAEFEFAKKSFTARHPLFTVPGGHKFFYAKYDIESVSIISGFGGAHVIPLKDYFNCKDSKY